MASVRATAPTARGPLGRGLVVAWALLLALAVAPCAAAVPGDDCGHCADHAADHAAGDSGTCLGCAVDTAVMPVPADPPGPQAGALAAAPPPAAVLAAEPPPFLLPEAAPRPPNARLYLTTRRLRL